MGQLHREDLITNNRRKPTAYWSYIGAVSYRAWSTDTDPAHRRTWADSATAEGLDPETWSLDQRANPVCDRTDRARPWTVANQDTCPHGSHPSYCLDCLEGPVFDADAVETALKTAMRLAPEVAIAKRGDTAERGIDVAFRTQDEADHAREQINRALADSQWAGRVSAWVWTEGSTGDALTDAGRTCRRELRLQPHVR